MSVVSVQEAARQLGASQAWVRKAAASGEIAAYQLGRAWAIDERALSRLRRRPNGRPLSPRSSWLALFAVSGEVSGLPGSNPVERQRARDRAARLNADGIGVLDLSGRAELRRFRGSPEQVAALASDDRVVRSGISAASDLGGSLLDSAREFEGYVREVDFPALVRQVRLEPAPLGEHGRILLRIPRPDWPFLPAAEVAPRAVVAVDLSESHDPRSRSAADELIHRA